MNKLAVNKLGVSRFRIFFSSFVVLPLLSKRLTLIALIVIFSGFGFSSMAWAQANWFGDFSYKAQSKADIAVALQLEIINNNRQWILLNQKDPAIMLQQPLSNNVVRMYQYLLREDALANSQLYRNDFAAYYCKVYRGYLQVTAAIDTQLFVYVGNRRKDQQLLTQIERQFTRINERYACQA
ncbi:hypothetical protein [Ostreibacterium oceani]|uniref:Uncharacterized protein n=1 Tax=Ostreibacterium oceani TaxID=2654998 RepID=A0A6N7EUT1_9GAMM|nr:hypothetical protein [Ostreibacterium oceani]MPV86212.1 hypothetical protein [Ostreibacterium oceani]